MLSVSRRSHREPLEKKMAPHGERFDRIMDLARDVSKLDYAKNDLRKYLGPEVGGLNVKQTEAIIALIDLVRGIILAFGALNKEMSGLTLDEGELRLAVGAATIHMKKDGSLQINGKNIKIDGQHDVEISAAHELHLRGETVE
jgi:hypothetical protein